ncbi:hypothetical protein SASPL_152549 [Salvia splendens]|uniref:Elongation factor Ts, mitochondrial n=1 Tax=Salvia splendens TaxID=180675 RepID=A0A8X8Z1D3_SALSN|nr:hypothetical protein SASPL_152549 [Salvia splendens]
MKEVKSALVASDWDIEAAQNELRKRGVALASKKSSRTAAEGFLALAQDEKKTILVELNCETDFVAWNQIFQHLVSMGFQLLYFIISFMTSLLTHHYYNLDSIGHIAGLLSLEVEDKDAPLDVVQRVGSQIAIAAKPLFLSKEDVTSDALGNERDTLRSQAEKTGKSQMAIDKMVEGRLRKYYEEVVLLEHKFIVDD